MVKPPKRGSPPGWPWPATGFTTSGLLAARVVGALRDAGGGDVEGRSEPADILKLIRAPPVAPPPSAAAAASPPLALVLTSRVGPVGLDPMVKQVEPAGFSANGCPKAATA